ncbi:hypothetical protein GCM10011352_04060 [Marinobacterium zhoushanense]|uniref:Uncharacterized protein n=1 Tax=Marinobacterium zhoushanense TaxID=1679163 RepID=A0ABQ1JYQ3_9GAMM|nr:hypothetical protein [Marinobacterium zhoushanense]GGB81500.1 hypothetical protein GCM10011352_04060 [Marinobacterium zhoushanense]
MPATEISLMLRAIDYAIDLLRERSARSEKEQLLQRKFVESFREALIQTKAYMADRRDNLPSATRDRELQLSQAWNQVGLCGRDLEPDGDFYEVYFKKSDFWSDPRAWDLSNDKNLDISLEKAEFAANKYLGS